MCKQLIAAAERQLAWKNQPPQQVTLWWHLATFVQEHVQNIAPNKHCIDKPLPLSSVSHHYLPQNHRPQLRPCLQYYRSWITRVEPVRNMPVDSTLLVKILLEGALNCLVCTAFAVVSAIHQLHVECLILPLVTDTAWPIIESLGRDEI